MRRDYKQLTVWQRAMDTVEGAYRLSSMLPKDERYELGRELRRSAVSIPSNIAEGHGRLHRAEFVHHLSIANGSVRELETQILIAVRLNYVSLHDAAPLLALVTEVGRMLAGLIHSVRRYRAA